MNVLYARGQMADGGVAYLWGYGDYQYGVEMRLGDNAEYREDEIEIDGAYSRAMMVFEDVIVPGTGVLC